MRVPIVISWICSEKFSLTAQEEILKSTAEDYFNEDYSGSERFEVELPLKNPTKVQTHQRVPLLAVSEKKSLLLNSLQEIR